MTCRSHALRVWALLVCMLVAGALAAAPASAAASAQPKHAKHAHTKGSHRTHHGTKPKGTHASGAKHPHRPTHPHATNGHPKGKPSRTGHHGARRSNLPVSIAPPPTVHVSTGPAGSPGKIAALWATPIHQPKAKHASHSRIAPTWVVAIPGAAVAVLALGGLVRLARRWRRPASAAS